MTTFKIKTVLLLFVAMATLAIAFPPHAKAQAISDTPAGEVRMDRISIVEMGSGAAVVLIPGLSTPRAVWKGVADELSRTHRVLLVQVNGFGGDDPGENLQQGILDGVVADILSYLDQQQLPAPAVVGHSMGGLVAMILAARHPESVDRLMIVDALPFFAAQLAPPGGDITIAEATPTARLMRDTVAARHGSTPDPALIEASVRGMSLLPENHEKMASWSVTADARVTAQAIFENMTTDVRPELPSIRAPITVVYPWNEQGLPKERIDAFYRRQFTGAGNISFVDIANAAHFVMLDQPDAFLKEVRTFLHN